MKKLRLKKSVKRFITIFFVLIFFLLYIITVGGEEVTIKETKKDKNNSPKIVDGILIVNKTYPLPKDYVPENTYEEIKDYNYCATCIDKDVYKKFEEMQADALSIGLNIWIQSGYRSYEYQKALYDNYVQEDGIEVADTYSARPGHSEHQTGLAIDITSLEHPYISNNDNSFDKSKEYEWLKNNCHKYGFILRYPKGKEHITGYNTESWHFRYVGVDVATKIYQEDLTLDEYYAFYIAK